MRFQLRNDLVRSFHRSPTITSSPLIPFGTLTLAVFVIVAVVVIAAFTVLPFCEGKKKGKQNLVYGECGAVAGI